MSHTNYLLFKVSVLEQVTSNEACRIAEDILTVICDPPLPSSVPSATPTPTPTRASSNNTTFNTTIMIPGSNISVGTLSGNGITLSGLGGTVLSYNTQTGSFTMSTLTFRTGNPSSFTEVAKLVFIDAYMNTPLRLQINNTTYNGTFINGVVYI